MQANKSILLFLFYSLCLISCQSDFSSEKTHMLSETDSAILKKLEFTLSYNDHPKMVAMLDSLKEVDEYQNDKLFRLNILLYKARYLQRINKYLESIAVLNQIISETAEDENFKMMHINALFLKGDTYYSIRNYPLSFKYLYEGRVYNKEFKDQCLSGQYDYKIAMVLYRQMQYNEASLYFQNSLENYYNCNKSFGVNLRLQEIHSNIGLCYFKIKQFDHSEEYYDSALVFINKIDPVNDIQHRVINTARGVIYGNKGKLNIARGEISKAKELLIQNIEINGNDKTDYVDALTSMIALAEIYYKEKNYTEYNKIVEKAFQFEKFKNAEEVMMGFYKLHSEYLYKRGDGVKAYELLQKYNSINHRLTNEYNELQKADIVRTLEFLQQENEITILKKDNHLRDVYIYTIIGVIIFLIIITIIIAVSLKNSQSKNKKLFDLNDRINDQSKQLRIANNEILKNIEQLKKRDHEKNKILSMVAHDLRTPNNAILNIIDEVLESGDSLTQEQMQILKIAQTSGISANDLINEILSFASPGQFETDFHREPVNCHELIMQVVQANQYKAKEKFINIEVKDDYPYLMIYGSQEKIRRAIGNILLNAIKFTHNHKSIQVFTHVDESYINIHVKDSGIGIPERIQNGLFESDPIIRRIGTNGEPSFGLGLTIVKQIIQDHSGKISFNTSPSGTEFILSFPLWKKS